MNCLVGMFLVNFNNFGFAVLILRTPWTVPS